MLTEIQIQDLIQLPKRITGKDPPSGYREENRQRRCDLQLESVLEGHSSYVVFVRQSLEFIENFSIGLRYRTGDRARPMVTLIRYNGPHGEFSTQSDQHFARCHIHRVTEVEMNSGSTQPQERHREITNRYSTFDECLRVFFADTGIENYVDYFPDLHQGRLFDGHG